MANMSEIFATRPQMEEKRERVAKDEEDSVRALTPSQKIVEQTRHSWVRGEDDGWIERERVGSMQGLLTFVSGGGVSRKKLAKKQSAPALLSTEHAPPSDNQMFRLGMLAMRSTETLLLSGRRKTRKEAPATVVRHDSMDGSQSTSSSRSRRKGRARPTLLPLVLANTPAYSPSIPSLVMSTQESPSSPDTLYRGLATPSAASIATVRSRRVSTDLLRNPPPLPVPDEGLPVIPRHARKGSRHSTLKHASATCGKTAGLRPVPRRHGSELSVSFTPWSTMPNKTLSMLLSELDEDHDALREKRMASEVEALMGVEVARRSKRGRSSSRGNGLELAIEGPHTETPSPGHELTECLESYFKPSPEIKQRAFDDLASPIHLRSPPSYRDLARRNRSYGLSAKASRCSLMPPAGQLDHADAAVKALAEELKIARKEKWDARAEAVELRIENIEARTKIKECVGRGDRVWHTLTSRPAPQVVAREGDASNADQRSSLQQSRKVRAGNIGTLTSQHGVKQKGVVG